MTTLTHAASQTSLLENARNAAQVVAEAGPESFRLRRPADSAIDALQSNGLTTMTLPLDRGGVRASMTTQFEVLAAIAEGDASVSWVNSVYNAVGHMICAFGDQGLDEYAQSDNPRPAGVFALTGKARSVDGGYVLSGKWAFASGQHHAGWIVVPAIPDDPSQGPMAFLVPKSEFTVVDDWYVTGLVATGSNSVCLTETFVPAHRAVPFMNVVAGEYRKSSFSSDPYYAQPFVPIMCALSIGTPIGLARAALRRFGERVGDRAITYTTYAKQSEAPVTHFQLSAAQMKVDQAEFHARRVTSTVDEHIESGAPWKLTERVRCRADLAWAIKLAREAIEIVEHGSGANSIREADPLPRILRDVRALSVHSFMVHSTNAELYGRVLAGLEPGVPFV